VRIEPPGGRRPDLPEPMEGPKGEKAGGPGKTGSSGDVGGAGRAEESVPASGPGGPQAEKLREVLKGVDLQAPEGMETATDRIIDWVLTERFGDAFSGIEGADDLRHSIRSYLLDDPLGKTRIKQIVDGLG
jgi:hypothetical protein